MKRAFGVAILWMGLASTLAPQACAGAIVDALWAIRSAPDFTEEEFYGKHPQALARVREMLEAGADPNDFGERGYSALVLAVAIDSEFVEEDSCEITRLLLENGADVSLGELSGFSPLHTAVGMHNAKATKILIDAGADPNTSWSDGATPLMDAATRGPIEIAELLLDAGADVDCRTFEGVTALMYAAAVDVERVELLLDHGAALDLRDHQGATALHYASSSTTPSWFPSRAGAAELLIERGAEVDATDASARTPLTLAAAVGQADHVRLLLGAGASVDHRDAAGMTPLHHAISSGDWMHLLAQSVDRTRMSLETRQEASQMLIVSAYTASEPLGTSEPAESVELLLKAGADPNALDKKGDRPIHRAARLGVDHSDFVEIGLFAHLRDPVAYVNEPLEASEILLLLIRFGADPEAFDSAGMTPTAILASRSDRVGWKLLQALWDKKNRPR